METSPTATIPTLASLPVELQDMIKPYLSRHDLTLCVRVCKSWHDIFINSLWHSVDTYHWSKSYHVLKSIQEFKKTPEGASSPLFTRHVHRIRNLNIRYTSLQELFCHPQLQPPNWSSSITAGSHEDDSEKNHLFDLVTRFPSLLSLTDLKIDFNEDPPLPSTPRSPSGGGGPPLFGTGLSVGSVSTGFSDGIRWTGFGASTTTATTTAAVRVPTTLNPPGATVIGEEAPVVPTIMMFGTIAPVLPLSQPPPLTSFGSSTPTFISPPAAAAAAAVVAHVDGGLGGGGVNFGITDGVQPMVSFPTSTPAPKPKLIDITPLLQILEQSKDLKRFTINLTPLLYRNQIQDVNRILDSVPIGLERLSFGDRDFIHSVMLIPRWVIDTNDSTTTTTTTTTTTSTSFGPGKKTRVFKTLKSLTMAYSSCHDYGENQIFELIMNLMDQCPKLEELNAFGSRNDLKLSKIIFKNAQNWKTLVECPGPLSAEMIVQHCTGLENLKILGGINFSSQHIQQLLCSARNLKRLDLLPDEGFSDFNVVFMANEIVESEKEWVCLDLESFKCMIGGIPRPDIQTRSNGRPLSGKFHDRNQYTIQQSRSIQRKILTQLGRLTKLREITLGLDNLDDDPENDIFWEDEETEGEYHDMSDVQLNRQYACLTLSLEDGLDLLKDLKNMRRLRVDGMSVLMQEDKERAWIKENWPEYRIDCRDKFWTSRGFSMPQGSCGGVGPPQNQEIFFGGHDEFMELYDFDWW